MPRPRKPKNLLLLTGAARNHPGRLKERAGEPIPTEGIRDPPERLTDAERAAWNEIASAAHPGTFCPADRIAVEIAARLLAEYRADSHGFVTSRLARLHSALASFGMTPADRSRINIAAPKTKNRFALLGD